MAKKISSIIIASFLVSASSILTGCFMGDEAANTSHNAPVLDTDRDNDGFEGSYEDSDGNTVGDGKDCDDGNSAINPGADELCDGKDNDCDGSVDEGCECDPGTKQDCDCSATSVDGSQTCNNDGEWGDCTSCKPIDGDGDGYEGDTGDGSDCDDTDAEVNPGADELCDGIDNDCDGNVDEGCECDPGDKQDCDCSATSVDGSQTCTNDGEWGTCSGCKSVDGDGDGYEGPNGDDADCDDTDASVNPGEDEVCDDGKDNDCDGNVDGADSDCEVEDNDADNDGYDDEASGGTDCDDTDASVNPGEDEVCDDGKDNDCDGNVDGADSDCEEPVEEVNPSAYICPEIPATDDRKICSVTFRYVDGDYATGTINPQGRCGVMDDSGYEVGAWSQWGRVCPTQSLSCSSGSCQCTLKVPNGFTLLLNATFNMAGEGTKWIIGQLEAEQAEAVCPSNYSSVTQQCKGDEGLVLWGSAYVGGTKLTTADRWPTPARRPDYNGGNSYEVKVECD